MRYQVLGEIRVIAADGVAVGVGGPRQQRLLVSLLLAGSAGRRVDELIEHMWDGDSEDLPDDPAASVRTYVGRLRSVVGTDTIIAERGSYRLERAPEDLDAVQFGLLSEEAAEYPEPAGRVEVFDTMLGLWQGPPFGEIGGSFWLNAEEARLTEIRAATVESRLDALLDSGRVAEVIAGARSELEREPFREGLRRLEMLALYRAGRQADALEAFQQHRRRLVEELGVEASPELRRLERLILEQDPSLESVGNAGRPLRGYRVHNVIGEGAFSIVHRATQPAVNRDVAIKVIRAELANQPEFIRRFEAEAQLVARLEHPHIVPLYDFWREPDRAYLVMRYLPRGSLATRLLSGPLSSADTYRIVEQLAGALDIAHEAGIAHRDIKPANVLLDAQGNAYLSDFGIAQGIDDDEPGGGFLSPGSPAYAAPEQVTQAVVTTASDIYSLGVMVYEMLTAELPWPEAIDRASLLRHQLEDPLPSIAGEFAPTSGVDEVISKATAKAPGLRFSSAPALADALREALDLSEVPATARSGGQGSGVGSVTAVTGGDNPFVGLEAFDEADADRFFGRERIVEDLITRLSSDRLAIVLGASGSGKSSVVRAGLVPAVRRGDIAGSDQWYVATMRVGGDPYSRLRDALSGIAVSSAQVPTMEELRTERGIAAAIRGLLVPAAGGEPTVLLLVLDQLEELFSQAEATEANRFLDGLADALGDSAVPLRVVGTLRADYLDRPLSHAAFGQLIRGATVTVPPMTPAELERAITAPVAIAGGSVEAGLVAQMVADTANLPSMLPLLQFALTELFELGDGRLTVANYDGIGGTTGALVDRADQVYESFDENEQAIARGLFGRLTNVAKTPLTARRVPRSSLDDLGERVDHVVDTLGGARLLSFGHDSRTREPTVEVAHEALLRNWPRLVEWLDSERTSVETVGRVRTATDEWIRDDRDEGALLRGVALDAASQLVGTGWLGSDEGRFVAASVAAHDREETEQRAQLVREQRTSRRLRRLLAGVAALTVIALVAGGMAFQQQRRADESADEAAAAAKQAEENAEQAEENAEQAVAAQERAEHEALISRAVSESGTRPTLGLLLAVEALLRNEGDASDRALLSALNTVGGRVSVIEETRFENVSPVPCLDVFGSSVYMIDFEAFAPRQETTTHSVVDLTTGEVNQFEAPSGNCFPAVSPDGSTVLLRHWDPDAEAEAAEAWDLETGSMIWSSEPGHAAAGWLSDDVVLLRPTGDDINENITDGSPPVRGTELVLADATTGEITGPAPFSGLAAVPSPDGEHWALQARYEFAPGRTWSGSIWQIVDRSGAVLFENGPFSADPSEVAWSNDGHYLALASQILGGALWEVVIVDTTTMMVETTPPEIPHEIDTGGFVFTFRDDDTLLVATTEGRLFGVSPEGALVGPSDQLAQAGIATVPLEDDSYGLVLEDGTIEVHSTSRPGPVSRTFGCCPRSSFYPDRNALVTGGFGSTEFVDIDSEETTVLPWPDPPDGYHIELLLSLADVLGDGDLGQVEEDYTAYIVVNDEGEQEPRFLLDRDGELALTPTIAEMGGSGVEFDQEYASPGGGAIFIFDRDDGGFRIVRLDRDFTTVLERIEIEVDPEGSGPRVLDEAKEELTITDREGSLITYDLATGDEVRRLEFSDKQVDWAVDLDGDGGEERYFAGRRSGEMFIVDRSDGSRSSTGYRAGFFRPRLVGEDRLLFADDRGAIRLLNAGSGEEVGVLIDLDNDAARGQVTLDGAEVIFMNVGDAPFTVALDREAWLEMACERAGRNLTAQEWEEFVPGDEPLRIGCPGL